MNSAVEDTGLLYHYTDTKGLLGILGNDCDANIHVKALSHMNDSKELLAFAKILFKIAELQGKKIDAIAYEKSIQIMSSFLYAFCMSKSEDDLSQWRGYCSRDGYAIGFEGNLLEIEVEKEAAILTQCFYMEPDTINYDEDSARKTAEVLSAEEGEKRYIEDITSFLERQANIDNETKWLIDRLMKYGPRFKYMCWKGEREWRILKSFSEKEMLFETGSLGLTPYMKIPIDRKCIKSIYVGPGSNMEIAEAALKLFLDKVGLYKGQVEIKKSRVPYR